MKAIGTGKIIRAKCAAMRRVAIALLLSISCVSHAQTGDPAAGERKAGQCAGCHGIPGWRNAYPPYQVPKLGGQHAEYVASTLKAYQAKTRGHLGMQGIAASLSDQDIADLAAFFSQQKPDR